MLLGTYVVVRERAKQETHYGASWLYFRARCSTLEFPHEETVVPEKLMASRTMMRAGTGGVGGGG